MVVVQKYLLPVAIATWCVGLVALVTPQATTVATAQESHTSTMLFETSDACIACHNGLTTPSGADVSIGSDWRASMMANAARDPYWQAAVRREVMDHPGAREAIEDKCSTCHMPMARVEAGESGGIGHVFAHLPIGTGETRASRLAADGVSCAVCHQIADEKLGTPESFTGGFVVDAGGDAGPREIFGPFDVDDGRTRIMQSASGFVPTESTHLQSSEVCATCHTLFTHSLNAEGQEIAEVAEQVPYLEWAHSAYAQGDVQSCQSCHMPVVEEETPISAVLGEPRDGFSRHVFRGGNFFMLRMLNRYRAELGVTALPQELDSAARRTVANLQTDTAIVDVSRPIATPSQLRFDVRVENLGGHKLPTAYPSRRVWLHVAVRDADGGIVFESGALDPTGAIRGNDNDTDPTRYEPHHLEISHSGQVQIYEPVMVDENGAVTTGLLTGVRYAKDNRLLPRGFDKTTAEWNIAVYGTAAEDSDFAGGSDRVRYLIDVEGASGPFQVVAQLWYQPIGYRWARNLASYKAFETQRFVRYYDSMAASSGLVLAKDAASSE